MKKEKTHTKREHSTISVGLIRRFQILSKGDRVKKKTF